MNLREIKNNKSLIILLIIIIAFFTTRLINLLALPIFTDEAIYMRWAQIALHDASWRFISLTDGKQPLFIWLTAFVMKYINNPLLSGRLVSVFAGFFGVLGSFLLGWEVFKNKTTGLLTSVLYILSPFFLWYDKIALMDSLLACFFIWCLFLEILLVRLIRLDIALLLGLTIGGAILTKTSGFFAIYLMPLMLLLYDWKKGTRNLIKLIVLYGIAAILAYGLYNILRLSPWFYIISQKDHSFIYTLSEILLSPFAVVYGNLQGMSNWWINYFTLSYLVFLLIGIFYPDKKTFFARLMLTLFFVLPFFALAFFAKIIYPRFILFMVTALLPLTAYGLHTYFLKTAKKRLFWLLPFIIMLYPLYIDSQIIFNVINSPLPNSDRNQYLDDWPAGYGVSEVIAYLKIEKSKQPVFIATEGTFGLFPYSLELEFFSDPSIKVKGYWPLPDQQTLINESEGRPAYLVLKESQQLPSRIKGELIKEYRRGKGNTFLKFYKLTK